jgi:hypothetical protein
MPPSGSADRFAQPENLNEAAAAVEHATGARCDGLSV